MTILLASATAIAVVDLCSKQVALHRLTPDGAGEPPAWFSSRPVPNRRGAIMATSPRQVAMLWLASALLLAAAVIWAGLSPLGEASLGLALGGATGNLVERLIRG